MNKQDRINRIEKKITEGSFHDSWASLSGYQIPEWYRKAKFGIFIHWGVYSVPAMGEWYARNMYIKDSSQYNVHLERFGAHDQFGYKDFIPMFKGENFDADKWIELFEKAGARYVIPVAEHHDGFQMYESNLSRWNSMNMGPCRDVVGELKKAADKKGMKFGVSSHRAEHCWYFNGGLEIPSDVTDPAYEDFYGKQQEGGDMGCGRTHDIYAFPAGQNHLEDWLIRSCELVDKYQPDIVWFDWWIHNIAFKPYLKKFAAYYYNQSEQWGKETAINYKYNAFAPGTAVFDVERGQLNGIRQELWQTDTAIGMDSWGYSTNNRYKRAEELIGDLVDIVSKNGCLLLNVGPKPDGTITEEETQVLLKIGEWLRVNGEGIYDTECWEIYGEGPTQIGDGAFTDEGRATFTSEDIRFTYKDGYLYAFVMSYPQDGVVKIRSIQKPVMYGPGAREFDVRSVHMLGKEGELKFVKEEDGLKIRGGCPVLEGVPVGFRIELD